MDSLPLEKMFRDEVSCIQGDGRVISWKGNAYAAFFRGDGHVRPVFDLPRGSYRAEWVDVLTGEVRDPESYNHSGGPRTVKTHNRKGGGGALRILREENSRNLARLAVSRSG